MPKDSKQPLTSSVDITPGVGVYGMFRSFNYKPWLALGEFLDNSITSFQQSRLELRRIHGPGFKLRLMIDYDTDRDVLTIRDNAAGIDTKRFAAAFALAMPPEDLRFISRYGVGMKAAACWFAQNWSVKTSAIGETIERTLTWSTTEITQRGLTSLEPSIRTVDAKEHYTVIELRDLIHPPTGSRTVEKIKSYLPNIYREFLRDGEIELLWNGQELTFDEYPVLEAAPQWDKSKPSRDWDDSIELHMSDGRTIRGRIFLLKKFKRAYTALNLFWHNRLIMGNIEPNHRPEELYGKGNSFETGRLCVELQMDEYEPTVDKMGFKFQDGEAGLEEIIQEIKKRCGPMLRQAREYREPKIDPDDDLPEVGPIILVPGGEIVTTPAKPTATDPYPAPEKPRPNLPPATKEIARVPFSLDGLNWEVIVLLGIGPGENVFVKIEEAKPVDPSEVQRLFMTIGTQHPFVLHHWSDDRDVQRLMILLASAIGFGEIAARRAGAKYPSYVRNNVDEFLRRVAYGELGN
jgi:hypothetical protein